MLTLVAGADGRVVHRHELHALQRHGVPQRVLGGGADDGLRNENPVRCLGDFDSESVWPARHEHATCDGTFDL